MKDELVLETIHIAMQGAVGASRAIMEIYAEDFVARWKEDGSPVTIADIRSNEVLVSHLEKTGIPFITEEGENADFNTRKDYDWLWCVDPLDGTKEFLKKNDEFAVCIALIHRQRPVLGIIASPVQEKLIIGGELVPPAMVAFEDIHDTSNWKYIERKEVVNQPLVIAASRSHVSGTELKFTNEMREKFGDVTYLRKGSALKFVDLALGQADVYPRFAPTMEWDIAAGHAIIEALGGKVVHAESREPLYYNKANLYNPYFIVYTAPSLS